ncbi:MAG: hypothetical protein NDJ89_17845 [Oligoflexia bacterium]|nr:hypothetical protein [Oligoflexia bacterium]
MATLLAFAASGCVAKLNAPVVPLNAPVATVSASPAPFPDFFLDPLTVTLPLNGTMTFLPSGGMGPYAFDVYYGGGSIDASGAYQAPASADTAVVRTLDASGRAAYAMIQVTDSPVISPTSAVLAAGNSHPFSVLGGKAPFIFTVAAGAGSVDASGQFTAPASAGSATLRVTDSNGKHSEAAITINASLQITPEAPIVTVSSTDLLFSATGGVPPIRYSVVSGEGAIDAQSGAYAAPAELGLAVIQASDALGNTDFAIVTIKNPLRITPSNAQLAKGTGASFGALGGQAPYTFTVPDTSHGAVTSEGSYTAPGSAGGPFTVTVMDAAGQTSDAQITVTESLRFLLGNVVLAVGNTQDFSVLIDGGVNAITFSVAPTQGTFSGPVYTAPALPGVYTVTARDSQLPAPNTTTATVTVTQGLTISPLTARLAVTNTQSFSPTGGVPPYTYSIPTGGGSINSSGLYTAPAASGNATVRVTDAKGNTADASITIDPALAISPASKTLVRGTSHTFTASGGVAPLTFQVLSGGGTINASSGAYSAPAAAGTATVRVRDSIGNTSDAAITIVAPLSLSPALISALKGSTVPFAAAGGVTPYAYSLVTGGGTIDSGSGIYTAPAGAGSATVRVTDTQGNTASSNVTIYDSLLMTPLSKTILVNQAASFTATGGQAPYTYTIANGDGSISGSTYTAPASAGTATMRVTDSQGNTSDAAITVNASLVISPTTKTLAVNNSAGFSASGGIPPYSFSASAGSIASGSGAYTAPSSAGSATVTVTDSAGNTAQAAVTISAALSISPATKDLGVNQNTSFTAAGGLAPYVYSVLAGGGSINSSSGAYTAPASAGSGTVRVTDALGNLSDSVITIYPAVTISPSTKTLVTGNTQSFTGSGGKTPYTYSVSGVGSVAPATGAYTANGGTGSATVIVTDALGQTANATITVVGTLAISPTSAALTVGGNQTFTGSGGAGPYAFEVVAGLGSVTSGGVFTASTTSGPAQVRVTDSMGNTATASITVNPGAATTLAVSGIPSSAVAGVAQSTLSVTTKDSYGNTATGYTGTVHFTSSDSTATLPSDYAFLAGDAGTRIFNITFGSTGTYSVTATDTVTGTITGSQSSITVTGGTAAKLVLSGSASTEAGSCAAYTVTLNDANNFTTSAASTVQVNLSGAGAGTFYSNAGCSTSTTSVSIGSGSSSATFYLKDLVAESLILGTTDNAASLTGSTFPVTITAGSASKLILSTASPSAEAASCSTITVTPKDANNNTATASGATTVLLSGGGSGTFYTNSDCTGSTTSVGIASGGGAKNFYFKDTTAESLILAAADQAGTLTGSTLPFTITAGAATQLALTGSASITAGSCATYTVTAKDVNGNATTVTSAKTINLGGAGAGTYYSGSGCSGSITSIVIDSGAGSTTVYFKDTTAQSLTLSATDATASLTASNLGVTVTAAAANKLAFVVQPTDAAPSIAISPAIEVAVQDTYGNLVTDAVNSISLAIDTNPGSGSLSGTNPVSASSGVAIFSNVKISAAGTGYTLIASATDLLGATSDAFNISSPSTLTAAPPLVPSDGLAKGRLLIAARDPVSGTLLGSGETIEVTVSSASVTLSGAGACRTPSVTCVKASSAGGSVYTITATASSVVTATFTAVRAGTPDSVLGTGSITFDSGQFTTVTGTTITSAHAGQNLYFTGGTSTFNATTVGQTFGHLFVRGGTVNHPLTTSTTIYKIDVNAASLTLQGGTINVNELGYVWRESYGSTGPSSALAGNQTTCGASHGGQGGIPLCGTPAATFDDFRNPSYPGGGGANRQGGGVIRFTVGGPCSINAGASLTANGGNYSAGGSIYLNCTSFSGTAGASAITANGGAAPATGGGGGGGGRVALTSSGDATAWSGGLAYPKDSPSLDSLKSVVKATGGAPYSSTYAGGGAGTIYLKHSDLAYGDLIIDNANQVQYANSGKTILVASAQGSSGTNSTLYSSPDSNTGQLSASGTPLTNMVNLFTGYLIHVFSTASPLDPADPSHIPITLTGNGANSWTTDSGLFPAISNNHYYRFVYQLDHLDIQSNAKVVMSGADLWLMSGCDLHSGSPIAFDVPAGSSLTGNSFSSASCSAALTTTPGTTVNFTNSYIQP